MVAPTLATGSSLERPVRIVFTITARRHGAAERLSRISSAIPFAGLQGIPLVAPRFNGKRNRVLPTPSVCRRSGQ